MVTRVLIIGGYGNFGAQIAEQLTGESGLQLVIGGRDEDKARAFVSSLKDAVHEPQWRRMDYRTDLPETLEAVRPQIVIHTSGPFQGQDFSVASACIAAGCNYVDLADARDFVTGISVLDGAARDKGVFAVSGASSVPCLTAAVVDCFIGRFQRLEKLDYGIATAQQTNRGLATTSAVLGYAGQPFTTLIDGAMRTVYGWQDVRSRTIPDVGRRFFGNCDVPDLAIFPERYPDLKTIRFRAGLEVPVLHFGLWFLTWLTRFRIVRDLASLAPLMLATSRRFDAMGSDVSAFYVKMTGTAGNGEPKTENFDLRAGSGDGPLIPSVPAIVLAKKLAYGRPIPLGAYACVGLIDLEAYLAELAGLDISWSGLPEK